MGRDLLKNVSVARLVYSSPYAAFLQLSSAKVLWRLSQRQVKVWGAGDKHAQGVCVWTALNSELCFYIGLTVRNFFFHFPNILKGLCPFSIFLGAFNFLRQCRKFPSSGHFYQNTYIVFYNGHLCAHGCL